MVYGRPYRHDIVLYSDGNIKPIGLIDAVLPHCSRTLAVKHRLLLNSWLDQIVLVVVNRAVVDNFDHKRFKYNVYSAVYVSKALVPSTSLLQPVMIAIDPYWLMQTYGVQSIFGQVDDDPSLQSSVFF